MIDSINAPFFQTFTQFEITTSLKVKRFKKRPFIKNGEQTIISEKTIKYKLGFRWVSVVLPLPNFLFLIIENIWLAAFKGEVLGSASRN